MKEKRLPRVVFQPATYKNLQRGIDQMVGAIRPTLGPCPRLVAMQRSTNDKAPEMLDNGGVIARRIIQIPGQGPDVGAMLIRSLLWRQYEREGDGTATTAVLFQSVFDQGVTYVTSGGNAMQLRRYLEKSIPIITAELARQKTYVEGKEALAQVAQAICGEPELSRLLGEIFDIVGEYGRLETRTSPSRHYEREYVEGIYWDNGVVSRQMIAGKPKLRAELENASILISDVDLERPEDLVPILTLARQASLRNLFIVARNISDAVVSMLLANSKPGQFDIIAVKVPGYGDDTAAALRDLAVLTGGQAIVNATGEKLESVTLKHLGHSRRAWADASFFGIIGGQGDPRALREHLAKLREAHKQVEDLERKKKLRQRIGKLMGGAATLWIGAATEAETEYSKEMAEHTAEAVRGAMMEGVVPGGGTALLDCRQALRNLLKQSSDPDERAAYRILIRALEEPARVLVANAGYDPSEILVEIKLAGPCHGFDVLSEKVVDMVQAGIVDAASVVRTAVERAISTAALTLTTDVIVNHKKPVESVNP